MSRGSKNMIYLGADHLVVQTELVFGLPNMEKSNWTVFCSLADAELLVKHQPHEWFRHSRAGLPSFFKALENACALSASTEIFEWKSVLIKITSKELPGIVFQAQRSLNHPVLSTLEPVLIEVFRALLLSHSWEKEDS